MSYLPGKDECPQCPPCIGRVPIAKAECALVWGNGNVLFYCNFHADEKLRWAADMKTNIPRISIEEGLDILAAREVVTS
jgi:hypothetical protein